MKHQRSAWLDDYDDDPDLGLGAFRWYLIAVIVAAVATALWTTGEL